MCEGLSGAVLGPSATAPVRRLRPVEVLVPRRDPGPESSGGVGPESLGTSRAVNGASGSNVKYSAYMQVMMDKRTLRVSPSVTSRVVWSAGDQIRMWLDGIRLGKKSVTLTTSYNPSDRLLLGAWASTIPDRKNAEAEHG